jgi:hypothetical protein
MTDQKIMIVVTAPPEAVERILDAISQAGGGIIGHYTHCAFTSMGSGRFKPDDAASPHVGAVGQINIVEEVRIETFCERKIARSVMQAIRAAHPYEEPVIYWIPLLSEDELSQ